MKLGWWNFRQWPVGKDFILEREGFCKPLELQGREAVPTLTPPPGQFTKDSELTHTLGELNRAQPPI